MMDDRLHDALRDALRPDRPAALDRDLWPRMQQRLAAPPPPPPWMDWALLVASAGAVLAFPQAVLSLLYHL